MIKSKLTKRFLLVLSITFFSCQAAWCIENHQTAADQKNKKISVQEPYLVGAQTKALLTQVLNQSEENYAVRYYLGMTALKEGNYQEAIDLFEGYLKYAPIDEFSASVRERLTLLKIELAEREARLAASGEMPLPSEKNINENAVAVFYFNTGTPKELHVLSKGMNAMIITDLSQIPDLDVVEREKIQAFVQEIILGQSDLSDADAPKSAGKFLMAGNVVQGTLKDIEKEMLDIDAVVTETINGSNKGEPDVNGPKIAFFELEKQLVLEIIESLGIVKEDLTDDTWKAIEKVHTQNYDAFVCFSQGLDLMDTKQFAEARVQFEKAVLLDASFDLAKDMLLSVPRSLVSFNDAIKLDLADVVGESDGEIEGFSQEPIERNLRAIHPESTRDRIERADTWADKTQITNIEGDGTLKISW